MTAIEFIQENVNPVKLLEYYNFRNVIEHENEIRACCEIHKGNNPNAFIWNKKNNLWFCYTGESCGGGDAVELVQKMEEIPFKQAVYKTAEILGLNIENMEVLSEDRLKKEQKTWLRKQIKNSRFNVITEYQLPCTKYYDTSPSFSRFDENTLKFYDAKFCILFPSEDTILKYKLVIPICRNNMLVGVALRDTTGTFLPKWMYMPKGLKASNLLYNFDRVSKMVEDGTTEEIILVEGIFDVWSFHCIGIDNVVAIFGSNLSQKQYETLVKINTTITLCFDNDVAGKKCTLSAAKMFKNKTELLHIKLPEGKDPGDCSKEELTSAYLKRGKYEVS